MDSGEAAAFDEIELLSPTTTAKHRLTAVLFGCAALYGLYHAVSLAGAGTTLGWPVALVLGLAVLAAIAYATVNSERPWSCSRA